MTISLILPYPPSLNTYYRHIVKGRTPVTLISEVGRQYRIDVVAICLQLGVRTLKGPISLQMKIHPPSKDRVQDIDNSQKALFDALQKGKVYKNDRQICKLEVIRGKILKPHGRVEITICHYNGEGSEYVHANPD